MNIVKLYQSLLVFVLVLLALLSHGIFNFGNWCLLQTKKYWFYFI